MSEVNERPEAVWAGVVGDRIDTTDVMRLLGITREELAKRVASGALIGLPGLGTTYFPVWQLSATGGTLDVKPTVRLVMEAFREELGSVDPFLVMAWATTKQSDLDGMTPAGWISNDEDTDMLVQAARRAAGRLAQ